MKTSACRTYLFLAASLLGGFLLAGCDRPAKPAVSEAAATPSATPAVTFVALTRTLAPVTPPVPQPTTTVQVAVSTAAPAPRTTPGAESPAFAPSKLGVHLLLDDGRNQWPQALWETHMQLARTAVGEWGFVVQLVRADDLVPERWQVFMDLCRELQLTPVLRLATTFDQASRYWLAPPRDEDGSYASVSHRYAEFMAALNWPTDRHFVIVGNEPNHGNEWSGRPDPEAYARFLMDVSAAIRVIDADAVILNAGFDPYTPHTGGEPFVDGLLYMDEESFLDGMVAAYPTVFESIDVWASHPYPQGPLTQGPWVQSFAIDLLNGAANPHHIEPPEGVSNRGINGYEWELFKLATYGVDPLPILITETGWRHSETTEPLAQDAGAALPDTTSVAAYLDLALYGNDGRYPHLPPAGWTPWLEDERVMGISLFALNGLPAEWGHTNLLILDGDGVVHGTYAPYEVLATAAARESARSD